MFALEGETDQLLNKKLREKEVTYLVIARRNGHVRNGHLGESDLGRRRHGLSLARGRSDPRPAGGRNRLRRRRGLERCNLATEFFGCRRLVLLLVVAAGNGHVVHVNDRGGFVHLIV